MTSFFDLGVPDGIASRLKAQGITVPTPIQAGTIAEALGGRDVCGRAPTGSGKTIAFGVPLVAGVGRARPKHPRGLVLVPTRELAAQVQRELTLLAGPQGARVHAFYGGVGFGGQLNALRKGTDIAVACPGRLGDLVKRHEMILSDVEFAVIDEADRMADMGFLPEVRRILDQVKTDRQTLLFSATLDGDVDVLIRNYQRDPVRCELHAAEDEPANRHVFWRVERTGRLRLTADVVGAAWPAIVFCRTKRGADRVARQLTASGVSAAAIHGDLSQSQRERALANFQGGRVQALVATDIAARGIHVDKVASVVHYDLPADDKDYVHRSGRTGRAGETGLVIALVGGEDMQAAKRLQTKLQLPRNIDAPNIAAVRDTSAPARAVPPLQAQPAPQAPTRPNRPKPAGESARGARRPGGPRTNRSFSGRGAPRQSGRR